MTFLNSQTCSVGIRNNCYSSGRESSSKKSNETDCCVYPGISLL
jgi:hypothetical protein